MIDVNRFDFSSYRMPAEWEPHEATWLAWPWNPDTWPEHIELVQEKWLEMMAALCPHEKVHVLVNDEDTAAKIRENAQHFENPANVQPVLIPNTDAWMRDAGPNFIVSRNRQQPALALQDFGFNNWGKEYYRGAETDDVIPTRIAEKFHFPLLQHDMVLEGGSIDVNGVGTLLTTTQCLLNSNRERSLPQAEIETQLKRFLGVSQVIWLGKGIAGDDTDGHVDDIARFVNPTTIVAAVEKDPKHPNYAPLQENLKQLRSSKDQDGRAFKIIELPMPNDLPVPAAIRDLSMFKAHPEACPDICPASYANFYIANNVVLAPVYSCPQDKEALDILQKLFSSRRVIGIECSQVVVGFGALHCVTQQEPAVMP